MFRWQVISGALYARTIWIPPAVVTIGVADVYRTRSTLLRVTGGLLLSLALAAGASGFAKDAREYFETPAAAEFAEAAAKGDIADLERLRVQGIDVNTRGHDGLTPAIWAVAHLSKKGYAYLLDHGANPNIQSSVEGDSAMSLSAMLDDPWWIKETIAHGGDVNLKNPISKRTPIFEALTRDREENVRVLIDAGANLNAVDKYGNPLVIGATQIWRYKIVYELLVAGADPTARGPAGSLYWWVQRSRITPANPEYEWKEKVVALLQEKGAVSE